MTKTLGVCSIGSISYKIRNEPIQTQGWFVVFIAMPFYQHVDNRGKINQEDDSEDNEDMIENTEVRRIYKQTSIQQRQINDSLSIMNMKLGVSPYSTTFCHCVTLVALVLRHKAEEVSIKWQ